MNAENRNEELILADFLDRSTADQQAAAEAAGKTPKLAMIYAREQARALLASGETCVAVEDSKVFEWTFRYFTDATIPATKAQPKRPAPTPEPAPARATCPPPKPKDEHAQLDMFALFDAPAENNSEKNHLR